MQSVYVVSVQVLSNILTFPLKCSLLTYDIPISSAAAIKKGKLGGFAHEWLTNKPKDDIT